MQMIQVLVLTAAIYLAQVQFRNPCTFSAVMTSLMWAFYIVYYLGGWFG